MSKVLFFTQLSALIFRVSSNLLQPEYSIKILNTENIILTLGDNDNTNNDLELVKMPPNPELDKKLNVFHKFVKLMEIPENPELIFYSKMFPKPDSEVNYFHPDYDIPVSKIHRNKLKKRNRLWVKHYRKRKRKRGRNRIKWSIEKRELSTPVIDTVDTETEYDYLLKDYQDLVDKSRKNNTLFKYTDEGKPEENIKEIIHKITDIKTPKNCTDVRGIGLQAVECLFKNIKNKEVSSKEIANKVSLILLVWILIYAAVAIPLWCMRGWCCCCCRCEFCFPTKTVREIQKYIAENPPGVYVNEDGEEEHYNPTVRETELYEKLKKSIAEF